MKKLIVIVAVVCAALVSQAASFDWKTSTGQNVYLMNASDRAGGMTAMLFDATAVSQSDLLSAFNNGTAGTLAKLASVTTESTGAIKNTAAGNAFSWGDTGDTISAYFAIFADDNIFISTIASGEAQASATTTLSFTGLKTPSQSAAMDSSSFAGAGWYTAGSAPEPTSGLLLLLGMAGLALKRKIA